MITYLHIFDNYPLIFTMQNYLFFVFIQHFTYTLKKLIKALIPK